MGKKIVNLIFLRLNQIKRLTQSVGFLLILLFFICVVGIAAAAIQSLLKLNIWWLIGAEFFILMLLSFGRKDRSFLFTIFESRTALILYNFVENILLILPFVIFHLIKGHFYTVLLMVLIGFIAACIAAFIPEKADSATKKEIQLIPLQYFELKFLAEKSPMSAYLFCFLGLFAFFYISVLLIWIFLMISIIVAVFTPYEPMEMIHFEPKFVLKKMISYTKILTIVVLIPFIISILFHPEHWLVASYALICVYLALYLAISAKYAAYTPLRALRYPTVSESIIVMLMLIPGGAIIAASFTCLKYIKAENNLKTLYATDY